MSDFFTSPFAYVAAAYGCAGIILGVLAMCTIRQNRRMRQQLKKTSSSAHLFTNTAHSPVKTYHIQDNTTGEGMLPLAKSVAKSVK